jgi:hypothetical protein
MVATPGATAQKATWATRKSGPLYEGLLNAPEANAIEPGGTVNDRIVQGLGPLQTSFCRVASKTPRSAVTVLVNTQPG